MADNNCKNQNASKSADKKHKKTANCVGLLKADTGKVVFTCTTHISVFFLPSWCNFGNI